MLAGLQVVRDGSAHRANELRVIPAHRVCLAIGKITYTGHVVASMSLVLQDEALPCVSPHPPSFLSWDQVKTAGSRRFPISACILKGPTFIIILRKPHCAH